jgi:pimeloyl-ACP methyl ester carboxylesterase
MATARIPILFIHGMYLNASSWDPWIAAAAKRGFDGSAVSWPFHSGQPAELRAHSDPALGSLTFGDVTTALKAHIDTLPERPVLVGHSIGGLAVQKLVNDGYARAGVSISPAPPQGVLSLSPTFFRANWPHINPFAGSRPVTMTKQRFQFTFCNTMTRAESDAAFERYVVPESRNVPRSTLGAQGHVDFAKPHVPLLLMAGASDHLTPVEMIRVNAKRYGPDLELREFSHRSHFLCNQDGWQEIAENAFDWIDANAS